MLCDGIQLSMRNFFRPKLSSMNPKTVRVKSNAENIEAMMPRVRVMAKPLTGPVACQKRMAEVISVVTLASKMAEKALL